MIFTQILHRQNTIIPSEDAILPLLQNPLSAMAAIRKNL